ncbi:MAG TPA: hypothetical protein VFU41_13070 [Gemmatimonadales bacterium]|nr:hypothetical protein [Gemmatimonadales bacterium]
MPLASAILWTSTVAQPQADPAYPIFITQRALAAVHDHVATGPHGSSSLGFLVGNVLRAPQGGKPYIVVESTIQVPWSIGGDHLKPALRQGRAIAEEELRHRGGRLVGWYHSRDAADARLSTADADAHLACFHQPWQLALVIARGADLAGGVFRVGRDAAHSNGYLPFYEVVDAHSVRPDGRKVTALAWTNYRTEANVLSSDRASQPDRLQTPLLLFPDEAEPEAEVLPAPADRRLVLKPIVRVAGFAALGIVAAGALFGLYRAIAVGPVSGTEGTGVAARSPAAVVALGRIDRLADTVAFAVGAFDLRVRLLESRKMTCGDLARGLVDLEERWTAYNAARQSAGSLDSARAARDRALYADVDAAERRFERSPCPRP